MAIANEVNSIVQLLPELSKFREGYKVFTKTPLGDDSLLLKRALVQWDGDAFPIIVVACEEDKDEYADCFGDVLTIEEVVELKLFEDSPICFDTRLVESLFFLVSKMRTRLLKLEGAYRRVEENGD